MVEALIANFPLAEAEPAQPRAAAHGAEQGIAEDEAVKPGFLNNG